MNTEIKNTQVSLEGLLEVLGENLYSTPNVAIRELIQNSYDACIRRQVESQWDSRPQVTIETNSIENTITITDNGSGLTRQEIIDYLATIGSGYTRQLRNQTSNENAVGFFGLGFLTAYVVSDSVELLTTSYQQANTGWRFISRGGQQYSIEEIDPIAIGTKIIISLSDNYYELADPEILEFVIQKYCCLLPIDIFLNDSEEPVNRIDVPWRMSRKDHSELRIKRAGLAMSALFDYSFDPITAIDISHDEAELKISGLLWFQDGAYYESSDNRVTTIFVRSMHITDECKDLLPNWAGFVGCIIDCASLAPTASRESIQQNEVFDSIKEIIKHKLVQALAYIAKNEPHNWRRLLAVHNQNLMGAAVSDPDLFAVMQDDLTLPTSEGELCVEDILKKSDDNKIRVALEETSGYEYLVSKSLGIPVVYGYRFAVMSFCRALADSHGIEVITVGTSDSSDALFPEANVSSRLKNCLEKNFVEPGSRLVISHYEPVSLPMVKILDQDALLKKRIESDESDRLIGGAALMMARTYTRQLEVEAESYVYLNCGNAIIKTFDKLPAAKQKSLANTLLAITNLLSNTNLNKSNIEVMEMLNDNLISLANVHEAIGSNNPVQRNRGAE